MTVIRKVRGNANEKLISISKTLDVNYGDYVSIKNIDNAWIIKKVQNS